jgi:hypothetical protein
VSRGGPVQPVRRSAAQDHAAQRAQARARKQGGRRTRGCRALHGTQGRSGCRCGRGCGPGHGPWRYTFPQASSLRSFRKAQYRVGQFRLGPGTGAASDGSGRGHRGGGRHPCRGGGRSRHQQNEEQDEHPHADGAAERSPAGGRCGCGAHTGGVPGLVRCSACRTGKPPARAQPGITELTRRATAPVLRQLPVSCPRPSSAGPTGRPSPPSRRLSSPA